FNLDPSLSLARVSETLPFTFTGADLYALCSDAMLKAVTRSARAVDDKLAAINAERLSKGQSKASVAYYFDHYATDEDTDVLVTQDDFMLAKKELVPSVSVDELKHYERVRNTFEGSTKKDDNQTAMDAHPDGTSSDRPIPMSRGQLKEFMKQAKSGKMPTVNGGNSHVRPPQATGGESDADDDFVIRTDQMSLNSTYAASGRPPSSSKGKGKGKGKDAPSVVSGDGSQANGASEEDLYD
ncbi:hypothetical protein KC318_g17097, partial [Hortaea werneckii]